MLRSTFIILISLGIAFGAFDKGEDNSAEYRRSLNRNPSHNNLEARDGAQNKVEKSELVHESKMPRIYKPLQTSQSTRPAVRDNVFVKWINKFEMSRMQDYSALTKNVGSAMRRLDSENELYGKISEDNLLESNEIVMESENDLMSLLDVINIRRLTFPMDEEDEYFCNPAESGIIFVAYIRGESTLFQLENMEVLKKAGYDVTKNTEILIHDWVQDTEMNYNQIIGSYSVSNVSDANLLFVDWSPFSRCEYMYTVNKTVPSVGVIVGKLVKELIKIGTDMKKVHLIGHGLGAHIASYGAKQFSDGKIARITGLDPAGPGYNSQPSSYRLDKTDADFVDVIHTDMNLYGIRKPIGHIDFYPNGGFLQKGCADNHLCSHQKVLSYFLESLYTNVGFYGVECSSYIKYTLGKCKENDTAVMGQYTPSSIRGKYYLDTNTFYPYAKGNSKATSKSIRKIKV